MTAINRRTVLGGLAAAATPLPAVAASQPAQSPEERMDPCEYHTGRLREELEKRHGGEWLLEVNHEAKAVFGRQLPMPGKSPSAPQQDPLIDAIKAYRDGNAAYSAAQNDDEETIARTYGPPLEVLQEWEKSAQTVSGVVEAVRLALENETEFGGNDLTIAMLKAALTYFEPLAA